MRLYFDDNMVVDKLDDKFWRAYTFSLGFSVYGTTKEDARRKLAQASTQLFVRMLAHGGLDRVKSRLDNAGLRYRIDGDDGSVRFTETRELELAGA